MARRSTGFSRGRGTGMSTHKTIVALREIGEHVVDAAKAALKNGADKVVADAKNRCPVRTGKLRDSIKAVPNRDGSVYEIEANAQNNGIYYGAIVEFSPRINKPFLYPALEQNRQAIYELVSAAISRAVRSG